MDNKKFYKRTTIWVPKELYNEIRIYVLLTDSNFSKFLRSALKDKIEQLKNNKHTK